MCVSVYVRVATITTRTTHSCVPYIGARVGKVSGIEVSGRVSGMPEMPGTKPRFWAPETARNCPKLPETARNYRSVLSTSSRVKSQTFGSD